MADRYGRPYAPRPRSPPLFNAARASLPINISSYAPPEGHLHAVPSSRREVITAPRSAASTSTTNGGTVTTTYKIKADGPQRGSSAREGSRTRRSNTLDNGAARPVIPTIVTETQRHRPVVHSGARPASPMKNAYRSSEEEYVSIPATSRHEHHHRKRYSAHLDSGDISRLGNEREGRLRVAPVREPAYTTRSRPAYASTVVRHPDNVAADYGDNGYGYTKPGDLAQYDLDHNEPVHHRPRRDSFESGRSRPTSITGYGDLILRNHEGRERGPPPSTRGFHKIRAPTWDQPTVRMPVPPSPMESVHRPAPFDSIEPPRRSNSRVRTSAYHDREPRRGPREEIYEIKDDQRRREHRRDTYDDAVEQRGFGIRPERVERSERPVERSDRSERPERVERSEVERPREKEHRPERIEPERPREKDHRPEKTESERPREKEHKGKEALTAGLSLAGAALGINAVKNAVRGDDREDRDDREERRRDKEESRRDRDDRGIDLSGRDPKERHSDAPPRKITPPRDTPSPREADSPDLRDRDPKERRSREDKSERRRSRHAEQAVDSRSSEDTSASEEAPTGPRPRRRNRDSNAQAFNPKDTMDLKALKEALNSKENAPKANTGETRARTPRESTTKDSREAAEVRKDLKSSEDRDRRPREPLASTEPNMKPRVVSPPRTTEEKDTSRPPVVKGILRQPREKFPEDPAPIREGVAPLKDSKRDGIPPDARWTKISRRLVNPEALEAGKERFEAREDFVIVLRVLSKEEVQGYAEVTQRIRAAREEVEEVEAQDRRAARRARHEKHKREQSERERTGESSHRPRREHRKSRHPDDKREKESDSGSDSTDSDTDDDRVRDRPRMLEAPKKKPTFDGAIMSGGLGSERAVDLGHLKETGNGVYTGYVRNPPPPVLSGAGRKERD